MSRAPSGRGSSPAAGVGTGADPRPDRDPPRRDLVVIGASAGGVEALSTLVAGLPSDLPAAVVVVLHLPDHGRSLLPRILDRAGALPAVTAEDHAPLQHGRILVAPPGHHAIVHDGELRLSSGPRENGHRPAIDPLFRSAARSHGPRTIAVVLSGLLDDGAAGLALVRERGGACLVQDPDDAQQGSMPLAAIATGRVDLVVPADALAEGIREYVGRPVTGSGDVAHGEQGSPDEVEIDSSSPDADVRDALARLDENAQMLRRIGLRATGPTRHHLERRAVEAEDEARALRGTLRSPGPAGDDTNKDDR